MKSAYPPVGSKWKEVDTRVQRTIEVIKRLRDMSPLYELAKEGVDLKTIKWKAE